MRIRACVQAYIIKQEADQTAEFLNAAAMGNITKIREVHTDGGESVEIIRMHEKQSG